MATGQGGTEIHEIAVSVSGDVTGPMVTGAVNVKGEVLRNGTRVGPGDELTFSFDEPISEVSLLGLKVTMGGKALVGPTFNLSGDGMALTLYLNNASKIGTVEIHLTGLTDVAGNPATPLILGLRIEEEKETDYDGLIILIIALIVIAAFVLGAVLYLRKANKGEYADDEGGEQTPQVPRQI